MESVNIISGGAGALSTYGLYAICVGVIVVCVHFYKRLNALEKEFRDALIKQAEESTKNYVEIKGIAEQTQEIIRANTAALEKFTSAFERRGR